MTWAEFWPSVAGDVAAAEPWDRQRYRRLVARLTALVAAGDVDGTIPPQDGYGRPMDWELDDLATAATAAGELRHGVRTIDRAKRTGGSGGEVGPRHRPLPRGVQVLPFVAPTGTALTAKSAKHLIHTDGDLPLSGPRSDIELTRQALTVP